MTRNRVTPPCVVPRSARFIRSVVTLPVDTPVNAEKDSKVQTNLICIMSIDIIESSPFNDKQNDYILCFTQYQQYFDHMHINVGYDFCLKIIQIYFALR